MATDMPQWLVVFIAIILPGLGIISFWMSLSSRLTKAETAADLAQKEAFETTEKLTNLSTSYSAFRVDVAKEYIHRTTMIEVEDRLTKAIDRLADRFDRLFTHISEKKPGDCHLLSG